MLGELERAIEAVAALDVRSLSPAEVHELVIGLQNAESLLAVVRAEAIGAWDAQRTWADDGSKAASARLARECRMSGTTARRELRRARKFRSMPHTVAALRRGNLSIDQADLLASVNPPELRKTFDRAECLLVEKLETLRYPDGARVVRYWSHQCHDELGISPWTEARDGRHLNAARTWNDAVVLGGMLDPVDGAVFLHELQRLEQYEFEHDWAEARAEHAERATADRLARTAEQRRADALTEMARGSAARPDQTVPARPLFTVLVGYDAFTHLCELADGTVVHPGQLVPYLTEADIERVVFDGPSRVIDVGVRQRFFTGALRRAIEVRDRHCQHPAGCDVPAERCQIDHIVPHSQGGLTTQANGRCYCAVHNRQKGDRADAVDPIDPLDDG